MNIKNFSFKLIFIVFVLLLSSCTGNKLVRHSFNGNALGTFYTIHYYAAPNFELNVEVVQAKIDSLLLDFNKTASIYNSNSIISKFNYNQDYVLNGMFVDIYKASLEISEMTDGAFDISVGELVNVWGFGKGEFKNPDSLKIDSLLQFVGLNKLKFENNIPAKVLPEVKIDMNGIAKGYAVDLSANFLESLGIKSYLVEIGGEIRVGDSKPNQEQWVVAIEKPSKDAHSEQEIQKKINISNLSMATSGNYRRYYELDGKRFSHTINPKTGRPVTHNLLSVTVITQDCMTADALATAFMVMGHEAALEFCKKHTDIEAYFIVADDTNNWNFYYTEGFEKFY